MTISGTSSVLTLISIIFLSITPSSTSNQITDTEIKHLCSKTSNLVQCFKLLKSDHRTSNVDAKGLSEISIDLTNNKANKIHSQLNSLVKATRDLHMRNIYNSCSKNYDDAIRDLEVAKKNLKSDAYKNMHAQVKDASEEIKSCEKMFNGASSSDHAHIKKKNQYLEFLVSIVKVTADNLNMKDDSDSETILRDLCSQIERSKECIDLIKSQLSRFEDSGCNNVAGPVIDLAREKAEQIRDMLRELHEDSNDDKFKGKYESCSSNYNDASRNLEEAKRSLDSNDYQNIPKQVDDTNDELEGCRREFDENAFDPAHIRDRNKEFGLYVDLLKVAIDRLLQRNESDDCNYYYDGGYDYGWSYRN
ncbi:hypothetical protein BUALT_Bualt03G0011500 [Buddleja alternifolia]|uniref:Pectinesterase inhibitor domain-containing protein n=1 Tax=Buddleja alternifolia TaxID=168488 RepID=A0AAV6XYD8_9LAMI|nr:hypothetical protein BUALT_Bualt03G0011500 [Buddleja alternifolia]